MLRFPQSLHTHGPRTILNATLKIIANSLQYNGDRGVVIR